MNIEKANMHTDATIYPVLGDVIVNPVKKNTRWRVMEDGQTIKMQHKVDGEWEDVPVFWLAA